MTAEKEIELIPGGDFCRIVKGSNGQQVLVRADADEEGKIVLVATAVFRVGPEKAPILAHQILEDMPIEQVLAFAGTPEQMFEYADALLSDLSDLLKHQLAHEGAEHVHDEHCDHAH